MARIAWKSLAAVIAGVICLSLSTFAHATVAATVDTVAAGGGQETKPAIANYRCLRCHADPEEKVKVRRDGSRNFIFIDSQVFEHSVHGKQPCTGCHNNVAKLPHPKPLPKSIGCIECHKQKWEAQKDNPDPQYKRLGVVVQQMESYMHSVHALPNKKDLSKTNAACHDCHDAHNIGTLGSLQRAEHRLKNPEVCGRCHEKEKAAYLASVHGKAIVEKKDAKSAVCSDCHTTHNIGSPKGDPMKLAITQNCGSCHQGDGKAEKTLDLTLRPGVGPFKEPYVTLVGVDGHQHQQIRQGPGARAACPLPVENFRLSDPASYVTFRPKTYLALRSPLREIAASGKHHGVRMTGDDLRLLTAWLDANCPYRNDEDVRALPDPSFAGIESLPIRPRTKTAPHIARP